ncbi:MAG TPA: GIY-YIG nuclease family protein [Bacteroidales bacterium]|nr:GIY-YIG nuclease family protein [Bacteroidales bacterium]HCI54713.1 hypothetical protein [Bacteroidales bacterium]HOU95972.1 GIY-YIG nuclease family protein [Bacteroidales bacterium]HQG36527.1 GIY-YIG nuclease family protein [Bacteroidales bacterium]HQG53017.1 GIY-YIG nuclease family protein [Bacteroidales bacterium]
MAGSGGQCPLDNKFWFVYILKYKNGSIYTGCTNNLEERIKQHNSGKVISTSNLFPM